MHSVPVGNHYWDCVSSNGIGYVEFVFNKSEEDGGGLVDVGFIPGHEGWDGPMVVDFSVFEKVAACFDPVVNYVGGLAGCTLGRVIAPVVNGSEHFWEAFDVEKYFWIVLPGFHLLGEFLRDVVFWGGKAKYVFIVSVTRGAPFGVS